MTTIRRMECDDCGCPVTERDENGLWRCDRCDEWQNAIEVLVCPSSEAVRTWRGPTLGYWVESPSTARGAAYL